MTSEAVDNIWFKLRNCADGVGSLDSEDANEILLLLSSLVNTDMNKSHEEVAESIFQSIGEEDLKTLDEEFLRYLTSHYAKVTHEDSCHDLRDLLDSSTQNNQGDTTPVAEEETNPVQANEDLVLGERLRLSSDAIQLLGHLRDWDFNIFQLESLTPYPLVVVAESALTELHLTWRLELNMMKLRRYLVAIQDAYLPLPYHNLLHGADVTQSMFHFCTQCRLVDALGINDLATFAILLAASIHDVSHPGLTGKFLVAVSAPLAIEYNDNSPLENMHLATAFGLWMKPQLNFTDKMSKVLYRDLRRMIIEMVLSTDNDRHFQLMEKVEGLLSSADASSISARSADPKLSRTQSHMLRRPNRASQDDTATVGAKSVGHAASSDFSDLPLSPELNTRSRAASQRVELASGATLLSRANRGQSMQATAPPAGLPQTSLSNAVTPKRPSLGVKSRSSVRVLGSASATSSPGTPADRTSATSGGTPCAAATAVTGAASGITDAKQLLLMQLVLHAADVSNPVKPWEIHMRWYPRLMEEFYSQGDKEKELGLPVTFAFDRLNPVPQPKFQLGFLKAIISPLYKTCTRIAGVQMQHCIDSLDANIHNWEMLLAADESGTLVIKTPDQVAAAAASVLSSSSSSSTAAPSKRPFSTRVRTDNNATFSGGSSSSGGNVGMKSASNDS